MGGFADYLENKLLDHIFTDGAYTPPATLYVALSTTTPTDAGANFTEPANAYARVATVAADWSASSGGSKTNTGALTFPTASGSWGTITYFGIYDASTSGNLLIWGALTAPVAVSTGQTPVFNASALVITLD